MLGARIDTKFEAFERGDRYITRVNKGHLDVERHTDYLNKCYSLGYTLRFCFEQNGNTVMIFEKW